MKNGFNPQKIKKLAVILSKVVNVLFWVSVVGLVLMIGGSILFQFIPEKFLAIMESGSGSTGFTISGVIRYRIEINNGNIENIKSLINSIFMSAIFMIGLGCIVFRQLYFILKTVKDDKPFAVQNAKRLFIIGILLIITAFILPAIQMLIAYRIMQINTIGNIDLVYTTNGTSLFTGLLVIILSGVFRYGSYLQQEFDDTV